MTAPEQEAGITTPTRASLVDIAGLFLKLGITAFGGPVAHIAMMEDEVVRRRRWLSREEFLDFLGATNLIPGPNSTELAIHIGRARAGWPGLLIAGTCFILPAALIVCAVAWAYVRFGTLPAMAGILYGIKPVVIAIIIQALWSLGRTALKTRGLLALGATAGVAAALGVHELAILAGGAAIAGLGHLLAAHGNDGSSISVSALVAPIMASGDAVASTSIGVRDVVAGRVAAASMAVAAGAASSMPFGLWPLFAVFLKIGAVLFGSGYVLLAFLRADLVERFGWLTEQQLLDAVAVGQVTPGPVFTTATFVGYLLSGSAGATAATVGIFLPAFVFVALSAPLLPRLRRSRTASAVLDGVNVSSLALLAVVTWQLGKAALVDPFTTALAVTSAVLLMRFRFNSAWLVLGGALVGLGAVSCWR